MSVALRLYEQLTESGENKIRAKLIAEAFEQLEDRYPELKEVATPGQLRETELRLQKEIEKIRLEIKDTEARLHKEIKELDLKIKGVEIKVVETRADLIRWVVAVGVLQTTIVTGVLLKIAHLI